MNAPHLVFCNFVCVFVLYWYSEMNWKCIGIQNVFFFIYTRIVVEFGWFEYEVFIVFCKCSSVNVCMCLCVCVKMFDCEILTFLNFHLRVLHLCLKDGNWRIAQFRLVRWPDVSSKNIHFFWLWCNKYGEYLGLKFLLRFELDWKTYFMTSFWKGNH